MAPIRLRAGPALLNALYKVPDGCVADLFQELPGREVAVLGILPIIAHAVCSLVTSPTKHRNNGG